MASSEAPCHGDDDALEGQSWAGLAPTDFRWHQDLSLVLDFSSASLLPGHLPMLAAEVVV